MSDESLEEQIRAIQNTLGPTSSAPPTDQVLRTMGADHSWSGLVDLPAELATTATESQPDGPEGPPPNVAALDPIWNAVRGLKALLCLIPSAPNGNTRLGQCVANIRDCSERDRFSELGPAQPGVFSIRMINYPRLEVNQFVEAAKPMIHALLGHIPIESQMRERLERELRKAASYLEHDDRGTIEGVVQPTGLTMEQQRNDARLEALAVFLTEVNKRPDTVLHAAGRIIADARVALDRWSFDVRTGKMRHGNVEVTDLSPEAVLYMKMVVEARPNYVAFKTLLPRAKAEGVVVGSSKFEQVKKQLPSYFVEMLDSARGAGTRLKS